MPANGTSASGEPPTETVEALRSRLADAEETLRALRNGQVDALVVQTAVGEQVFTLKGADYAYRTLVETMPEGAASLSAEHTVLYANGRLGEMLGIPLTQFVGSTFERFVAGSHRTAFAAACDEATSQTSRVDLELERADGSTLPARVALSTLPPSAGAAISLVISDLTEHRQHEIEEHMLDRLALAISTADSVGDALEAVLLQTCEHLGWPLGEAWVPDEQAAGLIRTATHGTPPPGADGPSDSAGGDVVQRARRSEHLEWASRGSTRRGLVAIPIMASDDVVCVLTFLTPGAMRPEDEQDAQLISLAARQLGTFIQRKRAEDELRRLSAELEQRVRERTAQLEAANDELEAFSYSVSHDLRAPLRAINGFSRTLVRGYGTQLDEPARELLERVCRAAAHMAELIDAMLALSRTSRGPLARQQIDLSAEARAVAEELRAGDPEREVEFLIEDGLIADGDPGLVHTVLRNLVGNAWKFTRGRDHPRIEVAHADHVGSNTFVVRDNGVGFDMAYADRLFQPFERLHAEDEFHGMGVGLATVKRIVRRHGGEVRGEGRLGQGAEFYFDFGTVHPPPRTPKNRTTKAA
jgi:PAS domain S-box-containing protein